MLKGQQILSLGVLEEESGSKISRPPLGPPGQRAAWCELEVDVATVRAAARVGGGGVSLGNDPQTQRHTRQAFHLRGEEERVRIIVYQVRLDWLPLPCIALIWSSQLSCLGSSVGRASAS